ncbi:MAG: DUF87 domain-containing protein [Alphaproteobacteria bacterium]|nr:MAG: DUF87 domain-containing protein [Alphaproteobacteria bacterium]
MRYCEAHGEGFEEDDGSGGDAFQKRSIVLTSLVWGPYSLGPESATSHFLVCGATGSGKTTLIDVLMRTAFEAFSNDRRALVYDAKQEVIPKLRALGLEDRIRILHPFHADANPWNMAEDIDDPLSARQLAQTLISDSSGRRDGDSSFFDEACRDIVSIVVQSLSLCCTKSQWTFRDLLLALLYPENTKILLERDRTREGKPFPAPMRVWRCYLDPETTDERTRGNIRASLNAKLAVYEPVAAAWQQTKQPSFSLKRWQKGNEILVLGNDEAARAAIDPINRALFQRASELTLARTEGTGSQTWFLLDEIRETGRLPALNPLLLKGRSKGACVVLSFQDVEGLREVYGTHLANEIVANCNNIALLRTNSAATAEWAAASFGKFLVVDHDKTTGIAGTDASSSKTAKLVERPAVMSGELLYLRPPSPEDGLTGYFRDARARSDEPKRFTIDWAELEAARLPTTGASHLDIDRTDLILLPWDDEDLRRLGLDKPRPEQIPAPTLRPRG